jgi:hypothetical protein
MLACAQRGVGFLEESVKLSMEYIKNLSRPTNLRVKKVKASAPF